MTNVRRTGAASAVTLSALALALGVAHAVAPRWAERAGLDVWNLSRLRESARDAERERVEIEARQEELFRQIEAGEHMAARLAGGGVTLARAADELERVMRGRPGFELVCQLEYRVTDPRRGAARYAIDRVRRLLADDPDAWAAASARLEAEYAAFRR